MKKMTRKALRRLILNEVKRTFDPFDEDAQLRAREDALSRASYETEESIGIEVRKQLAADRIGVSFSELESALAEEGLTIINADHPLINPDSEDIEDAAYAPTSDLKRTYHGTERLPGESLTIAGGQS